MNILISGASGFVGQALCLFLQRAGHTVTKVDRSILASRSCYPGHYDCLISLAGRAHVMQETSANVYQAYAEININYTLKMAQLANDLNIKRFVFLSSIKVNGERSTTPFTSKDQPFPHDEYGKTKLEAEIGIKQFCESHGIEWVIIRPPLIYGPAVKANFKSLIKLCKKPLPLPFGSINNKRSLISLDNLNSFITLCCEHPHAVNQIFLISDDQDISTKQLIRTIRVSLGQRSLLLPFPPLVLNWIFNLIGKKNLSERLLSNLQVDISNAKELLNWRPIISFEEGIKRTVSEYAE